MDAAEAPPVQFFHSCAISQLCNFTAVQFVDVVLKKNSFLSFAIFGIPPSFLHKLEHFLHIFCVLIFQAQSFAISDCDWILI